MDNPVKLIVIILVGLFLFIGAILVLLWFFRDRFVPKVPAAKEPEEPEPEEEPVPARSYARPERTERSYTRPSMEQTAMEPDDLSEYDYDDGEEEPDYSDASTSDGPAVAHLEDILDCVYLPGRRLSECGIPASFVSADGSEVQTDGMLFGEYAYGALSLKPGTANDPVVDSFYVIGSNISFHACKGLLSGRFGDPVTEGEQEDEEGGKTEYAGFSTDFGTLWLSQGSGNDYLNLNFTAEN